VDKTPVKTKM
jgi:hypothetical protein